MISVYFNGGPSLFSIEFLIEKNLLTLFLQTNQENAAFEKGPTCYSIALLIIDPEKGLNSTKNQLNETSVINIPR